MLDRGIGSGLRQARMQCDRWIAAGVLASVVALVSCSPAILTRPVEPPEHHAKNFAAVRGWIAYGTRDGIWAVDPEEGIRSRIQLSDQPGDPVAWSRDGSKLLVMGAWSPDGAAVPSWRPRPGLTFGLFVLHADGTETAVVTFDRDTYPYVGSSLSFDGSQVLFVEQRGDETYSGIYLVNAHGGTPRLLRSTSMEPLILPRWRGDLYWPAFSPDATRIAYFHGGGDHSQHLKMMNADGTNARDLFGDRHLDWHVSGLVWAPDGSELAFATDGPDGTWGIWAIGADGSGYRRVTKHGSSPSWSPDGSRIAFRRGRTLYTVAADGSDTQRIRAVSKDGPLAWNPVG
jgi:Tol biopolymer transport system component